ncbi:hypothetical protein DPMN_152673 [Dreissena polymorpha]|uniref:Uncharacterized protein n=1 Tax=Dreissena polymorpha TaxID=45954 RepID=A0A9D4J5D6_DREPO|nr:hypothetical protein DPMN_152673 [Dreissena polymorpha]
MDLIKRPDPVSCVIEGDQVMASSQVVGSIPEPGYLMDECEWGDGVESAPVVCEWISARNSELTAFDSHFHLDRSCKVTKVSSIDVLVGHSVGPIPQVPLRVFGGGRIAVLSDPPNYPRE